MKNAKKLLALLLSAVLLAAFAGCGNSGGTAQSQSEEKKLKIGLVKLVDHPSLNEINDSIKTEFEKLGTNVEFIEKNANGTGGICCNLCHSHCVCGSQRAN